MWMLPWWIFWDSRRNFGMLMAIFFFPPDPGEPEEIHGIRADAELGEGLQAAGKGAGSQLPRSRHRR